MVDQIYCIINQIQYTGSSGWIIDYKDELLGRMIKQTDNFNCGPIAWIILWGLLHPETIHKHWYNHTINLSTFREVVIKELQNNLWFFINNE